MSVAPRRASFANFADLRAIPEADRRHEIIDGELVQKPVPSARHGRAQRAIGGSIGAAFDRPPGGGRPGGWWIVTEVEVELTSHQIYRPDVCGWRRDRLPELPEEAPIAVRPDWVCEVLSRNNARNDLVKKMRVYHLREVPHYWIVDPDEQTLAVYRWTAEGYLLLLTAERGDKARAEPFGEIEIDVGALFGDVGEVSG